MIPSLKYVCVFALALIVFPFAMVQMGTALDQEDLEGFYLWVGIASIFCGLPLMMTLTENG